MGTIVTILFINEGTGSSGNLPKVTQLSKLMVELGSYPGILAQS